MHPIVWFLIILAVLAAIAHKKGLFNKKDEANAPAPVVKSPVGKWVGDIVQANQIAWADANDEHTPAYTAQVLAQEPSWRGLQYCPGGTFSFEVHPDGGITGGAVIFITHPEPVQGRPVLANGATEIEFNLASHKVRLKFDGDTVSGLLWEGHDLLKRANIVGKRA